MITGLILSSLCVAPAFETSGTGAWEILIVLGGLTAVAGGFLIQVGTIAKGVELGRKASPEIAAAPYAEPQNLDFAPATREVVPMATKQQVTARVEQILTENFNEVEMYSDEGFTLRQGSARAFVEVESSSSDHGAPTFVRITVPLLQQVTDSQQLHRHVAFSAGSNRYGSLMLRHDDAHGTCIYFVHTLLGNYLDDDELGYALSAMLSDADDLDDELQSQFGGKRFHED